MNENNVFNLFIGKKFSGKTYDMKMIIPINEKMHIICDTAKKFDNGEIFLNFDQFATTIQTTKGFQKRNMICRFFDLDDYNWVFTFVREFAEKTGKGLVLLIDEVQVHTRKGKTSEDLANILSVGRNFGIDILAATNRPLGIDHNLTAQADCLVVYQINEDSDLEYLSKVPYIGKENAYLLPTLNDSGKNPELHEKMIFGNDTLNLKQQLTGVKN